MTDPTETEFRRRWHEAHVARLEADEAAVKDMEAKQRGFVESAAEAMAIRDTLARTGDTEAFRLAMENWAAKPGTLGFNGFAGQMTMHQLVYRSSDDPQAFVAAWLEATALPEDDDDAARKIDALAAYIDRIRKGANPAPGRSAFLLSYMWALQDQARWSVMWTSAAAYAEFVTGTALPTGQGDRYRRYLELVREVDDDNERFERVAVWWERTKPVFLDAVLVDRSQHGFDATAVGREELDANAAALMSVARYLGSSLLDDVAAAADRTLTLKVPDKLWQKDRPRSDLWVDWCAKGTLVAVRVWVNHRGAAIGLRPGVGQLDRGAEIVSRAHLPAFRVLGARGSKIGDDVGFFGSAGEFVYAKWYEPETFAGLDLRAEVKAVAAALQPLVDELVGPKGPDAGPTKDDPLRPVVDEFLARGYPTPADLQHTAERKQFAAVLAPDVIGAADPAALRKVWNSVRYGSPGFQAVFNASLRDADAAEYDRIVAALKYVCWGPDDDAERIDAALTNPKYAVKGLGEGIAMKLLAVCHPERYVPVYPASGDKGKRRMLQLLGIAEPEAASRGQFQVRANDLIRARLDPFFPDDPWGMAEFLYWYSERGSEPEAETEADPIGDLADELLVDRSFLDDIVELLKDKGQVILYGPPGTGKTYIARKLAEALVPDASRRGLVQFHPSTSYEDFFEGYRPEAGADGELNYRLTPGPLALLAERALESPGRRHIMIIDEINRANLPKVLGELLFLLEYRDEQVSTLYRPEEMFQLPKDLWFIGTMNTADRSIALVDAALRRRFHFVPFFPDRGPMQGLLGRWFAARGEPTWVADLVALVNDELIEALGGPHLQLGPSHFMKPGLDESALRRIWEYNIEPFIEDQFFGDPSQIEFFRFATVMARYLASTGVATVAEVEAAEAVEGQ